MWIMSKKLLSREEILGANDLPTEDVEVPEWEGSVRVRTLTGTERDEFESSIITMKKVKKGKRTVTESAPNLRNIRAKLVARSIVKEDGTLMFPNSEDVFVLGEKSAAALDRVYEVSARLSKITDEDIEELEKNSSSGQSESSITD